MRCLVALLAVASACAAEPRELFNGHDLAGWEFTTLSTGKTAADVCTIRPDGVIAAAGLPVGFLATTATYANYRLHAEWRWPGKPNNSGVLVHISSGPKDRVWPACYQIQTKIKSVGDVLPMAGATFAEPLTSAPGTTATKAHLAADSEKPAGEWNTCDITCRGGTIEVVINGVLQNRVSGCSLQAGKIGFQFEGTPFELRHVSVVSLD